jgi:hypothetical protein
MERTRWISMDKTSKRSAQSSSDSQSRLRSDRLIRFSLLSRNPSSFFLSVQLEETSDVHYAGLHKKWETFEKRQRRQEKERLQHERYKMQGRVDLIRGLDGRTWVYLLAIFSPFSLLSSELIGPCVDGFFLRFSVSPLWLPGLRKASSRRTQVYRQKTPMRRRRRRRRESIRKRFGTGCSRRLATS